jgi:hypothetical protein
MTDVALPAGPLFGPDSVTIDVGCDPGPSMSVPVLPDAQNTALRAAGQPAQFYVQPARLFLAHRQASPDLDFSMTAVAKNASTDHLEFVGGSCTFAATLALPDSVIAGVADTLMGGGHPDPPARIAELFTYRRGDPTPALRMVPIVRSDVSVVLDPVQSGAAPAVMNVQHSPAGSIEPQGLNSFLVSCSPSAAEEIVAVLRNGAAPPFVVRTVLTEQFDTGPAVVTADLVVEVDKVYEALSDVMPPGGPPAGQAGAEAAYRSAISVGAVRTTFTEAAGGPLDARLAAWMHDTDAVKKAVFGLAGEQLFDVAHAGGSGQAQPNPTWWDSLFGDSHVALKGDFSRTGAHLQQTMTLHGAVFAEHTVEGDLSELAAVTGTQLDKYLTVVGI